MQIKLLEWGVVTQWPYWAQALIILTFAILVLVSRFSEDTYSKRVMLIINLAVLFFALQFGIYGKDWYAAIFLACIGGIGLFISQKETIILNKISMPNLMAVWLVLLSALILYFDLFARVFFSDRIYINWPFRLYFSGYVQWGIFLVISIVWSLYYWALSGLETSKAVLKITTILLAVFWAVFFSVHLLDRKNIINLRAFNSITEDIYLGVGVNATNKHGSTLLHKAVGEGDFAEVKRLVEVGADVNYEGGNYVMGRTPLMKSLVFERNLEIAKYLIQKGAKVDQPDKDGFYPIHALIGAKPHNAELLELLVNNGADISIVSPQEKQLIHMASEVSYDIKKKEPFSNAFFIEKLVTMGADVDAKDKSGHSPLHFAIIGGSFDNFKKLIDLGASLEVRNNENETMKEFAITFQKEIQKHNFNNVLFNIRLEGRQKIIDYLNNLED